MFPAFIHLSTATCLNTSLKIGVFFHFSYCYLRRRRMITSVRLQQSWQRIQFTAGHYRCHHEHLFLIVDIIRFFPFYLDISLFWHRRLALCMKAEVRVNWISNQSHYYWWSCLYERAGAKSSMVAVSIVIFDLEARILTSKIRKQSNRDRPDGARKELGRESQGNRSETPW